ncbi:MAG TPA: bifunctional glutamate N-acetyltransferase/amino-acid acetyltransferase ArgJ [Planctomycetaceae bacterium]|nr:bifunctional glutamate N-acetyltransferase/amino-acid acetyltransferase ArgJ [Planctomycetaceae bacterium]
MSSDSTIPLPLGFEAAGIHCGIKKNADHYDLALFVSQSPATAAGVFTTNLVQGAPVRVSRSRVPRATIRGIVINSGNANACTGQQGLDDARWMTALVGRALACGEDDVLVCSTGVIGRFLPREKLEAGIPVAVGKLDASPVALLSAACAIMTTDTFPKQATREGDLGGKLVRVSGVAKGAAMIAPNMGTMLSVILTDAALEPVDADALLRHAVDRSFNCISVEGHMSTSDTVLLLANGAAGTGRLSAHDRTRLQQMVDEVAAELAEEIIRDAEGADHEITIDVRGLRTRDEAYRIAKAVAESPLVKTAIAGGDPNWGRIVSAVGYAGVALEERDITLRLNDVLLYQSGTPLPFDAAEASAGIKNNRRVHIELEFPLGHESLRFWTCDLTAEYVRLNADYTT